MSAQQVKDPNLAKTDREANERSLKYHDTDPLPNIQPSLLSATEIVEYVEKTGLIYPFSPTKELLKHASYEGRIGSKAFRYNEKGERIQAPTRGGFLELPHNSITFVESDITFRLPRYIGLRFNLQIKHVHRGILLGTGPLIDPGFQGKLLIPLHNLTSEDYYINVEDGLIWIEFTKTTYDQTVGHKYGEFPERKNISNVEEWLDKAEKCAKTDNRIPIRSSIPLLVADAQENARRAQIASREARKTANRTRRTFFTFGFLGAASVFVGAAGLIAAFGITLYQQYNSQAEFIQTVHPDFASTKAALEEIESDIGSLAGEEKALREGLAGLEVDMKGIANMRNDIGTLEQRYSDISSKLEAISSRLGALEKQSP